MHEILNSPNRLFKELRSELKLHFDLMSAIDNNAASEVTFDYIEKNCLDGEFLYVCVLDDSNPLYVLGRRPEYEMEDDEEFATQLRFSDTNTTFKKCINYCRKNAAKLRFIVIDLFKVKSRKKNVFTPYDMQWHCERTLEKRKEQALKLKLYKFFVGGTNYTEITLDLIRKEIYRFMTMFAKYLQPVKSFELKHFEYEKEGRYYCVDCIVEFTHLNDTVDKYNSIHVCVRQESAIWSAIYRHIPMVMQALTLRKDYITRNCFVNFNSEFVVKECESLYNKLISNRNA